MPRFMVTCTLPPMSDDQMHALARNIVKACDDSGSMTWIRSDITADGHSFCEFEARDAGQCRTHATIAGLPVDEVFALGADMLPATLN